MDELPQIGRRERKKLETWRSIRRTALQLIVDRGFHNVSFEDIAEAADVSRSTLFNYFRSKEALLFDADPEERSHWETFMAHRPPDESPWTSLEAFFLDYTSGYETKLRLRKQLQEVGPALNQGRQDAHVRVQGFLANWLETRLRAQGLNPDDRAFLLGTAFVAMDTAFARWDPTQEFSVFQQLMRSTFQWAGQGLQTSP